MPFQSLSAISQYKRRIRQAAEAEAGAAFIFSIRNHTCSTIYIMCALSMSITDFIFMYVLAWLVPAAVATAADVACAMAFKEIVNYSSYNY